MVRERRRYLSICIHTFEQDELSLEEVWRSLKANIRKIFGDQGLSLANPSLIEIRYKERKLVIHTSCKYVPMVRAAVASIKSVGGRRLMTHVDLVTGNLRRLKLLNRPLSIVNSS